MCSNLFRLLQGLVPIIGQPEKLFKMFYTPGFWSIHNSMHLVGSTEMTPAPMIWPDTLRESDQTHIKHSMHIVFHCVNAQESNINATHRGLQFQITLVSC